jgi:cell division protease FtsH
MVCEWGMSDAMGPMSFGKKNEEIFLGREIQSHRDYSEQTAQQIDHEVVTIIKDAQKTSHKILTDHIDLLHLMAEQLLEHETIDEADIKLLVAGKKLSKKNNK